MHIMVVDSGIGGLSVFATLERSLGGLHRDEGFQLTFANASPEDNYGYNSMKSREEQIETFDRFLANACTRFEPDLIYLACNTLTVLFPFTSFFKETTLPVLDIISTGIRYLYEEFNRQPDWPVLIFATPTTVLEGTLERGLVEKGIHPSRMVSKACPGLADSISADLGGQRTRNMVEIFIQETLSGKATHDFHMFAYLGCTHYGYRMNLFQESLEARGIQARVLNPNRFAVDDIVSLPSIANLERGSCGIVLQVVSRYRIPPETLRVLEYYLAQGSPETVRAIRQFQHIPDFF